MKKILSTTLLLLSVLGFAQDEKLMIQNYLEKNKSKYNLTTSDVIDWKIQSKGNSDNMGTENYYIIQQFNGVEIFRAVSSVAIKNNTVFYYANNFVSTIDQKIANRTVGLNAISALAKLYVKIGIVASNPITIIETIDNNHLKLDGGFNSDEPIVANLVYQLNKQKKYDLSWDFTIHTPDHKDMWSIRVNANTGEIIEKDNMMISCDFHTSRAVKCTDDHDTKKNIENSIVTSLFNNSKASFAIAPLVGSYNVIPYNYISPNHTSVQLIASPANLSASPRNWHDTNGLTGNTASLRFNYLRGNNVWSRADYTDTDPTTHNATAANGGYSPTSSTLNFNFPYGGISVAADTYIDGATTNLFYMTNVMHDVWWHAGFNEANGNFQQNNYGKGGSQSDFVWADAQDGSKTTPTPSLNNANFGTPTDGTKPRMQMFLWSFRRLKELLTVNSPADIAGGKIASDNGFNPGHVDVPVAPNMIQSNLVLMDDGTPDIGQTDNADGCTTAVNAAAINGKIVLIRRSTSVANGGDPCTFVAKALVGQAAGAAAVIIVNNDASAPNQSVGMSGAEASLTIPVISISKNNGDAIINKLKAGQVVNAKIQADEPIPLFVNTDGDYDNGVIAHEFGHGISTRLAGGPNNSSCLNNLDQMGEGWSDWFSLMMQLKTGDVGTDRRTIGTFVQNEPLNGEGLRSYPYSTDMTKNPLTYINSNSPIPDEPADTGYRYVNGDFWSTVLWDLNWAYIAKYGFDSNIYTGVGGNNKVMKLVLDGLKLQPCSPTVVSARDALFAAEQATTSGVDYCMIAEVFRRRGVGKLASAGSNQDCNDQVQDFTPFDAVPTCTMAGLGLNYFDKSNINVYPNPSNGLFNIRINQYDSILNILVSDMNGRAIINQQNIDFNNDGIIDMSSFTKGIYVLKVTGDNLNYTQKLIKN